jgi:molybdopterin converting factor subunit 1
MNHIKVLFFATLRDRAGTRSAELEVQPGLTIEQLKLLLVERYPGLRAQDLLRHCLASINHEYRFDETVIPEGAEIALFPPVSGG